MNPTDVAQRIGDRLEESDLPYAIGGFERRFVKR
jgi:hypothetical protein